MKYLVIINNILFTNLSFSTDLTRQTPIEKTVFLKGQIGLNHFYEPSELIFYTGKLYKLIIKNVSKIQNVILALTYLLNLFLQEKYN